MLGVPGGCEFWWRIVLLWVSIGVGRNGERWWWLLVGGPRSSRCIDGLGSVSPTRKMAVLDLVPVSVSAISVSVFALSTRIVRVVIAVICGTETEGKHGGGCWGKGVAEFSSMIEGVVDPTSYLLLLLDEGVNGFG